MTDHIPPSPDLPRQEASPDAPVLTAGPLPPGRRSARGHDQPGKAARRPSPFRILRPDDRRRSPGWALPLGWSGGAFALHTYDKYAADLPSLDSLSHYQPKVMSRVYAADSRLMAELATERRIFVPDQRHPRCGQAGLHLGRGPEVLDAQGRGPLGDGCGPPGIDVTHAHVRASRPIGASTITQQVAKNMLLSNEVSIARKVKELILAVRIDRTPHQGACARTLPERDLPRPAGIWRGCCGPDILQQGPG